MSSFEDLEDTTYDMLQDSDFDSGLEDGVSEDGSSADDRDNGNDGGDMSYPPRAARSSGRRRKGGSGSRMSSTGSGAFGEGKTRNDATTGTDGGGRASGKSGGAGEADDDLDDFEILSDFGGA